MSHYEVPGVVTSEVVGQSSTTGTLTLSGLKSATAYTVTVKACLDKPCGYALTSVGVTGAFGGVLAGSGEWKQLYDWNENGCGWEHWSARHAMPWQLGRDEPERQVADVLQPGEWD